MSVKTNGGAVAHPSLHPHYDDAHDQRHDGVRRGPRVAERSAHRGGIILSQPGGQQKGRALLFRIVAHDPAGTGPAGKHTKAWMKK
ncbi:MAG: hypothetical protein U0904_05350 [Candidatus Nanopelagicales bacterium]|nr:hypothetical protein [Candidatus Nanopelagicales bacterium]